VINAHALVFLAFFPVGATVDLPTIVAVLDQNLGAIKTLEGRLERVATNHNAVGSSIRKGTRFEDERSQIEFLVDVEQNRTAVDELMSFVLSGISPVKFVARYVVRFDGERGYFLHSTSKEAPFSEVGAPADVPHDLQISSRDQTIWQYLPHDFLGLRLQSTFHGQRLVELLRSHGRLDGTETISGAKCVRCVVTKGSSQMIAWFDVQHGYMPRRIQYFAKAPDGRFETPLISFDVIKFARGILSNDAVECWMPVHALARNPSGMEYNCQFTVLRINSPLDRARFQISPSDLPDGVRIDDGSMQIRFTGERGDLWRERTKQINAQEARQQEELRRNYPAPEPESTAPTVQASTPPPISWLQAVAIGVSSLLLVAGAFLLMKRRRS
jgi:hypothetical protein